jgi:hypothetical protein
MTHAGFCIALAVVVAGTASCARKTIAPPAAPSPAAPAITDGSSLVSAMRGKYGGQWFKTVAISQNNTLYNARGGETKSQWREQISVPGKLRIDYVPLTQRSGVLFDGSRIHTFDNGRAIDVQPGVHPLLLLMADVYVLPIERSLHLLDSLGFDLSKLRRDTWDGQPVYVVGAAVGDSTTSQFWVDSTRLVALRVVRKERSGTREIVTDARFSKFADFAGFPMHTELVQYRDGRLVFRGQYADIRADEPISDAVFDPAKWVAGQPK